MSVKLTENQSKIMDVTALCQIAIRLKRDLEPEHSWTDIDENLLERIDTALLEIIRMSQKLYHQTGVIE